MCRLAAIYRARTDITSLANSKRWICVAESFVWLGGISSASALKILPQARPAANSGFLDFWILDFRARNPLFAARTLNATGQSRVTLS